MGVTQRKKGRISAAGHNGFAAFGKCGLAVQGAASPTGNELLPVERINIKTNTVERIKRVDFLSEDRYLTLASTDPFV